MNVALHSCEPDARATWSGYELNGTFVGHAYGADSVPWVAVHCAPFFDTVHGSDAADAVVDAVGVGVTVGSTLAVGDAVDAVSVGMGGLCDMGSSWPHASARAGTAATVTTNDFAKTLRGT